MAAKTVAGVPLKRAARVILVGAPGVGKGTQAERMMGRYPQLSAVSSGDLLRAAVREQTPIGEWKVCGYYKPHTGVVLGASVRCLGRLREGLGRELHVQLPVLVDYGVAQQPRP